MSRSQHRARNLPARFSAINSLTASARLCLLAIVGLPGISADAQLLHRYDFKTAGSANDTVGTAHGTIYGSATVSGGALNTTGGTGSLSGGVPQNCVGLPASAVAGVTNGFSIEIWYSASYNGPWCTLFSLSANNTANYVLATTATGSSPYPSQVEVIGGGGNTTAQQAYQIYTDNATLHDMIVTYDGSNVTYYLDGTLSTFSALQNSLADPVLALSSLTYIGIGGGSPWRDNTINGKVYDFRIYGQALTLNQVAAIYSLGTNASNASISNALATSPAFGVPFNGNLVRMPFYGTPYLHDPGTMRKSGGSYFIFGDGTGIPGITSADLRNWSSTSAVFPSGPPAWTTNAVPGGSPNYFWAPDLACFNGLWHVYYAYSQWGTINSAIGVATSPSLTSPVWTDQGKVIQSPADINYINCIDPSIYVAPNGTVWMSFGSYSGGIIVMQIDPATGKGLSAPVLVGGGCGTEGSCIYQHGGYWYLFLNFDGCCNLTYSTYNIRVGRSSSPTGPYIDRNGVNLLNCAGTMVLESTARYIGPGHAAICDDNGTNWFTYHFYDGLANGYPTVGMNQLYWSADGWPVMTNDWSVLYPLAADANESSGTYNGTLQNSAGFTNDPVRGQVLYLDGVTNYVSLPLSVGNASTFATWVKWKGGNAWQRVFDFGNDTAHYFFLTPMAGNGNFNMRFAINAGGGEQQLNAPFTMPTNSWHYVAVTLDGSTGILYLDGVPVASSAIAIRPWQTVPHNNFLGKSQFSADPCFAGEISSFRIFGRALSAAEISDIFAANPTLSHRYSFSTNATTAVWDSIGMAHGTLIGNAVVTNNALKLNGVSGNYANLPGGLVSGSSAVTLECWATFGANGNWARVFDTGNITGAGGDHYFFYSPHNGSGGQQLELNTSSTRTLAISGTLDNRGVHVACICDPANNYMAVYTNGVLEAQLTASMPPVSGGVANAWSFIGRSLWSADAYLNATIDELRLYDGRLTPQQIADNYIAGPNLLRGAIVPNGPAYLTNSISGHTLSLSWPAGQGWRLQMETNVASPNWVYLTNGSINSTNITVDPTEPSVFYRLTYP
jgi:hypothetical protein